MNINSIGDERVSPTNSFQSDVESEWIRFHAWMQYKAAASERLNNIINPNTKTMKDIKHKIAEKVAKALQIGELNPYRVGEIEAKIGFSLNLKEDDVAWAMRVWNQSQKFSSAA